MEDNMNNTGVNENENNENQQETKTYSAEEVAKLIQAEADRRTNQALAKQKKEYEKKLSLSSLDEQQRNEFLNLAAEGRGEAQMKIEELQSQLAAFQIEKNKSELKSVLSSRGLSAEFADILSISDDLEESQANIDKLDKLFKAAVKAEVEKRLAGNSPKGSGGQSQPMTKEDFLKLPMHEMQRLMDSNKEFYTNLLK